MKDRMNTVEFANLVGLSTETIRALQRDGVIAKEGREFDVAVSLRQYLSNLRKLADTERRRPPPPEPPWAKILANKNQGVSLHRVYWAGGQLLTDLHPFETYGVPPKPNPD
jgi:hypothetical protein